LRKQNRDYIIWTRKRRKGTKRGSIDLTEHLESQDKLGFLNILDVTIYAPISTAFPYEIPRRQANT
jgi:hypothetical protein